MLDIIRRKQKSPFIKIVFWTVIAAFILGAYLLYTGSNNQQQSASRTAVIIDGDAVPFDVYQNAYNELENIYRNVYGESFTPGLEKQLNLKQQALERTVNQALLLKQADEKDLAVSQDEIVAAIAQEPAFQKDGAFDKQRYLQVLQYNRMSANQFEKSVERRLLLQKVSEHYQQDVTVNDAEIEEAYRKNNQKINLNYVQLVPALFDNQVTIEADKLEAFFKENIESFRLPQKVSADYILLTPKKFEPKATDLTEAELKKYYNRHLDQFEVQEQVKASHLLVRVPEGASAKIKAEKRALAERYLAQVQGGEDFSELARAKSDDQSTATKGGDLGYFGRGAMIPAFENVAFSLEPGQVSEVIETSFGYHLIKVFEHIKGGTKPFARVIDEVREGLQAQKGKQIAYEKAYDAYNMHRKDQDLATAAQQLGLEVDSTGLFTQNETVKGLGRSTLLTTAAFAVAEGELVKPVQLSSGVALLKITRKEPSRLPELSEVKAEVEAAYRRQEARKLAAENAKKIANQLDQDQAFTDLAAENNLSIEETGLFSRTYGAFIPTLGSSEALAKAAFALTPENPNLDKPYQLNGMWIVGALKEKKAADMSTLDEAKKNQLRQRLLNQKKQQKLEEVLSDLRDEAEILLDPEMQNFLNQG